MNKALVLALFLGIASASTITGWTYPANAAPANNDRFTVIDQDWATINGYFEFDFGWSTHYKGEAPGTTVADVQAESYGVNLYSYALLNMDMEFAMDYENNMRFYFEPFMVAPYTQTVAWMRPESGEFHVYAVGTREIRALNYATIVDENTKVGKTSLYQTITNGDDAYFNMDGMYYEEDFKNMYMDPYWSGNLLEDFVSNTYTDLVNNEIFGV